MKGKEVFAEIIGFLLLLITLGSVISLMIICAITYIPYYIYKECAEVLSNALQLATKAQKEAEMRDSNK